MKIRIKRDILEQTVLLSSVIKWIFLALFAGLVVGTATSFFLKLLNMGEYSISQWNYYYLLMPIAFFMSSLLVVKLAPEAEGHGTEKVIEAVHKKAGKMDIKVIPVKLVATLITLVFGGSAGKEGPCAQIGAGIASFFANLFKMDDIDRKRFVICGISAGFTGVFGTPIAGAIFAAEVLYIGNFSYIVLLPSLIASYVSYMVSGFLGTRHISYTVDFIPSNDIKMFLNMIVFGIFIGLIAMFFISFLHSIEEYIKNIKIYKPLKGILGGIILIIVVLLFGTKDYIGLGTNVIDNSLEGGKISKLAFLVKMFTTSVTLGSGGSGGILTPIFYIGATAGNAWAQIVHGNISLYSAIGMISFLAACTNTPIAAIIMSMELFGINIGFYASIVCVVSYLIVGHRSVYPSQILKISKSPSISFATDCEVSKIKKISVKNKHRMFKRITNYEKD